jgi:MULE transposase domain
MPAAWMISSNGTEDTINFFLKSIRTQSPSVFPEIFMSDKDHAQMNAIRCQYPKAALFLCWWHVLHAWRQHFVTTSYPELWELLKKWIRIEDQTEFWEYWAEIKALAPASVIQYFETYWLQGDNIQLWSAIYRKERTVFQECDTNMLVEAWHHLLKGTFMEGKRNRRLDHLIHILIDRAIPYFIQRHRRQEFGFEGGDLKVEKRLNIER